MIFLLLSVLRDDHKLLCTNTTSEHKCVQSFGSCVTTWDIPPIGFLAFTTWPSSLSTTHTSFLRVCVHVAVPALQASQMLQLYHEAERISGNHLKELFFPFFFFSCTSHKDLNPELEFCTHLQPLLGPLALPLTLPVAPAC